MIVQEIDKQRALYLAALCEKLGEWFPQFHFGIISAHFMWCELAGAYGSDLSPLRELGIEPKTEKPWTRNFTTWEFWVTEDVHNKVKERINKVKQV